ncbi:hypothetical protein A3C78_00710 [Candidatus Azambacteria bacterium RIFCSPHIGHO2_02_FULL_45_18]|nr:MAG: hypothetical protein A3C78_00710 [Candidatus Azambacteria bacterium RIFCSPHIGHO2_02_FULL_45_18]
MKTSKKILIFAGGILLLIGIAVFFGQKNYFQKPDAETAEFHSRYGFTLQYPKDWIIDDSQKDAPAEFIREPNGGAFYSMQAHTDPRVTNPKELKKVYRDIEDSFKNDARYLVEESGWEYEEKNTADNSYFAAGSYTENGENWQFKEITVFSKSGNVLVLRGMSLKDYANEYEPIIDKIFASVVPTDKKASTQIAPKITQEEALAKIKNLPEVQEFMRLLFPKQAEFEVEDWDTDWAVHVFELVVGENSVHRATFNWYRVDKQTGVVEKEF